MENLDFDGIIYCASFAFLVLCSISVFVVIVTAFLIEINNDKNPSPP